MNCAKVMRKLDEAAEDHPRVAAHLEGCAACRRAAAELGLPGRLLRQAGAPEGLDRLRLGLAASVTARLAAERPVFVKAWLRPVVLGAAALLALLASLVAFQPLLPAGGEAGPALRAAGADPAPASAGLEASRPMLHMRRNGDSVEVLLDRNGDEVHRVAVSTSPDFARRRVSKFRGTRWVDPAPAPIVGGVVFYRID
jgi:hypothetical protein